MKENIKEKINNSIEWSKKYYSEYFYTDTSYEKENEVLILGNLLTELKEYDLAIEIYDYHYLY